ncbi:MAG: MarR family transcriptional regulator [Desulfobacterales bacterium]
MQKAETIKEIVSAIRQLSRAVYMDSAKMSRRYGLTSPQSGVLRALFTQGPLSSTELSRRLFVTPSNITGIIDRLEKKGLVERLPKARDRRVTMITLTPQGQVRSHSLPDPIEKKLISGLGELQDSAVEDLSDTMRRLITLLDAQEVPDSPLELPP